MQRTFDELKIIRGELDELEIRRVIRKFFDEMDVSEEDKTRRTALCIDLEKALRNIFILSLAGDITREECAKRLYDDFSRIARENNYKANLGQLRKNTESIAKTTFERANEPYTGSTERSILIAQTNANSIANYDGFVTAYEEGKTAKIWHTMRDNKVRETHSDIDGMTIGIFELFAVGDAEMRFPCDDEMAFDHPEELVNCRCTMEYI